MPAAVFDGWLTKLSVPAPGAMEKLFDLALVTPVADAVNVYVPAMVSVQLAMTAWPSAFVRYGPLLSVPSLIRMAVGEVVATLPKLSRASTMNGLSAVPALPLPGWLRKMSWLAAAALITNGRETAVADPAVATSVYVPAVSSTRSPNTALPVASLADRQGAARQRAGQQTDVDRGVRGDVAEPVRGQDRHGLERVAGDGGQLAASQRSPSQPPPP